MTLNPMENAVLVAMVSDFTSIHDLANFRLVSKLWYKESLKKWRSNVYPRISPADINTEINRGVKLDPEVVKFLSKEPRPPSILVKDLVQLMKMKDENILNLSGQPYRNYRLDYWRRFKLLGVGSLQMESMWSDVFKNFFTDFGNLIYHLDVSSVRFKDFFELEDAIFKKTPNLKTLILGQYYHRNNEMNSLAAEEEQRNLKTLKVTRRGHLESQASWITLFRHFPNVENIIIPNFRHIVSPEIQYLDSSGIERIFTFFPKMGWKYFEDLLNAVKFMKNLNANHLPLQNLDFPQLDGSFEAVFNLLREMNLPLKSLTIDITHIQNHYVEELIAMFADTLTSLVIRGQFISAENLVEGWPFTKRMESLQSLEVIVGTSLKFSFIQYTPNLRKLRVMNHMFGDPLQVENFSMDEVKISSLREFHADYKLNNGDFKLIKDWMPNLEKLAVPLSSENLGEVCYFWKDSLHELKLLCGSDVNDEAIIGSGEIGARSSSCSASIKNLKYLRTFKMEHPHPFIVNPFTQQKSSATSYCKNHNFCQISVRAIKEGFLQLEHLQMLQLCVESEVGNELFVKLKEKGIDYDIKVVNINNCKDTLPKLD